MSDDLISRRTIKSLIETIRDCWAISPYVSANDMKLYAKVFNVVLRTISDCRIAFDKEKVIDELQNPDPIIRTFIGKSFTTIDRAIEIVEKGGIE